MQDQPITKMWSDVVDVAPGIRVYKNMIDPGLDIINKLESILGTEENPKQIFNWMPAFVGYRQRMPEYRDCVDFKYKKTDLEHIHNQDAEVLREIWQQLYDRNIHAVNHYRMQHNIMDLRYWEAMNFVRYGEGQHFQEHHDHGYSYNCVTSLVSYLNDDYEGGEIEFRTWGIKYKPEAGDTVIFPSNYMWPHKSCPVTKGVKYAVVTMLDYSDKYHKPEMYQETGT